MDVDCVDSTGTDEAMRQYRQSLPQAIGINSVGQMVRAIEAHVGTNRIRRLRIFGHGESGRQSLGGGQSRGHWYNAIALSGDSVSGAGDLQRLKDRFAQGGWVELHGCNVGHRQHGHELLIRLARLWQVNVAGGTFFQTPDPGFEYQYAVASPQGRLVVKEGRQPVPASSYEWLGLPLLLASPVVGIPYIIGTALRQLTE